MSDSDAEKLEKILSKYIGSRVNPLNGLTFAEILKKYGDEE